MATIIDISLFNPPPNLAALGEFTPIRDSIDARGKGTFVLSPLSDVSLDGEPARVRRAIAEEIALALYDEISKLDFSESDFERTKLNIATLCTDEEIEHLRALSYQELSSALADCHKVAASGWVEGVRQRGVRIKERTAEHPPLENPPDRVTSGTVGDPQNDRLLTAEEVANILAVPTAWVYAAARDGRLPCVRIGRYVRFRHEALDVWIRDNERGT